MNWRAGKAQAWAVTLASMALPWANLPYLIGYLVAGHQAVFSDIFIFEQDGFASLARMRQGAEGSWLFHLPFATEPHREPFYSPNTSPSARRLDRSECQ
jgi:hypothetical protein